MRVRRRPFEVDAVQWTGANPEELYAFAGGDFQTLSMNQVGQPGAAGFMAQVYDRLHSSWIFVYRGDWVIRGLDGEFYPVRESVFPRAYEPADSRGPEGEEK